MTRTESPRTYSPRRLKMDKENVQKASASSSSSTKKKMISTPSPSKRLSSTSRSKTPTSSTLTLASSSPRSAPGTPIQLLTPPGSSKLLRQHFQQLSMSAGRRSSLSSSPYHQQSQTRMMDTGPVRLLSPRYGGGSSSSKSPIQVLRPVAVRKSTTGGGGATTPTTEVLAATDCDTSAANSEQSSFSIEWTLPSTTGSSFSSTTPPNQRQREMDCMDPVAFTLLRGGEEDLEWLIEHDRSHSPVIPIPPPPPSSSSFQSQTTTIAPSCNLTTIPHKVSSSLRDVYGEGYVSREIARPVPVFARRQKM